MFDEKGKKLGSVHQCGYKPRWAYNFAPFRWTQPGFEGSHDVERVSVEFLVDADSETEAIEKAKLKDGEEGDEIKNTYRRDELYYDENTNIEVLKID